MKTLRRLAAFAVGLACAAGASATTIIPPTFNELVTEADTIVRGTVTEVHSVAVPSSQGPAIHTLVTLKVERALKGSPGDSLTLTLLGGTVGRRTLRVEGLPQFHVGERTIVFVAKNGRVMCPVIGARHGLFRVTADANGTADIVTRDNGQPLTSVEQVPQSLDGATPERLVSAATAPLDVQTFEARITDALAEQRPNVAQPE
jgi:hypothetical protein